VVLRIPEGGKELREEYLVLEYRADNEGCASPYQSAEQRLFVGHSRKKVYRTGCPDEDVQLAHRIVWAPGIDEAQCGYDEKRREEPQKAGKTTVGNRFVFEEAEDDGRGEQEHEGRFYPETVDRYAGERQVVAAEKRHKKTNRKRQPFW
jgi:hypothetical protein